MHVRLRNHFLTKLHLIWGLYVAILTLKKLYRAENQINCLKKALSVKKKKKERDSIMFTLDHHSQFLMFFRTKCSSNV